MKHESYQWNNSQVKMKAKRWMQTLNLSPGTAFHASCNVLQDIAAALHCSDWLQDCVSYLWSDSIRNTNDAYGRCYSKEMVSHEHN